MANTKIHLMAFEPKGDVKTIVHTVGLPAQLQEAFFRIMPPRNEVGCLRTDQLKSELRCWLDLAVELNPIYPGKLCQEWLIALKPVDLERLCNVVANWLIHTCSDEVRGTSFFKETLRMLQPDLFSEYVNTRSVCLFDEQGRPEKEAQELTFPAFSAQVANALVGRPLYLPGGECLTFSRLSKGTGNDYELVSNVLWHKEYPYAFVLRFHVETLPISREARLNVDVRVRRFIHKKWTDNPYPFMGDKGVNAYVRTNNGTLRVIPYRYDRAAGHSEWDAMARGNYEGAGFVKLPSMEEYFANMASFAGEGQSPQILSPYSSSAKWAAENKVASGAPIPDKASIFSLLADALAELVTPVEPVSSVRLSCLHTAFDDPGSKMWDEQPQEAESQHELWAKANRRRLAACTGESRISFELIGTAADKDVLDAAKNEVEYFLGKEGLHGGVEVTIAQSCRDELLMPLKGSGDADIQLRWRRVESVLGKTEGLTACIVALPDAKAFEEKGESFDPKVAIRMGLARTGRLSQFIVPVLDESFEHRVRAAVRDLMRQLGFMPEFEATRGGVDLDIPTIGLRVYSTPQSKENLQFPIAVRVEPREGRVSVDCPLFKGERLPYWKAQLELARMSTTGGCKPLMQKANGRALKSMVDKMRAEATRETLLLVQAYGRIRCRDWWPGLSDTNLARGSLYYGPTSVRNGNAGEHTDDMPFELGDSQLSILRVRSAADGEVPDYFTDEKSLGEAKGYYCKQGLFLMGRYVLALTAKPNGTPYNLSLKNSKFDDPSRYYAEKTLNEYCLLTSDDEQKLLEYAKYAEALRGNMVQLVKSDMKVNLPVPLHLAADLGEYIWAPEKSSRRKK